MLELSRGDRKARTGDHFPSMRGERETHELAADGYISPETMKSSGRRAVRARQINSGRSFRFWL